MNKPHSPETALLQRSEPPQPRLGRTLPSSSANNGEISMSAPSKASMSKLDHKTSVNVVGPLNVGQKVRTRMRSLMKSNVMLLVVQQYFRAESWP